MSNKEKQLRIEVRKILIEEYATNGLEDLSSREVVRRLKILEAKTGITNKPKLNHKLLGAKNTDSTFGNADFLKGKIQKSKMGSVPNGSTKAPKLAGKRAVKQAKMQNSGTAAKFSTKKEQPFKAFNKSKGNRNLPNSY